jgi:Ca2+-binding RTX toxin-like protein
VSYPRNTSTRTFTPIASIEHLEKRRLLAATLDGTLLRITGTRKNDAIVVTLNSRDKKKLDVRINKDRSSFTLASVKAMRINSSLGEDSVKIDQVAGAILLPTTIYGGDGDDSIVAGAGRDRIYGMGGNDTVFGGSAADILYGDAGEDRMLGENGRDRVAGGAGDDWLEGNRDHDSLVGDDGADILWGGDHNDRLDGGAGLDSCSGGAANDTIAGGVGDDMLNGETGDDSVMGGDGADFLSGDAGTDSLFGGPGRDRFFTGDRSSEIKDKDDEDA